MLMRVFGRSATGRHAALWMLILLVGAPAPCSAFSPGPPDGSCGDPPDYHFCTACHASFPLNSGDGDLDLLGLPPEYTPDSLYTLTVYIEDLYQRRWGFEMTAIRPMDWLEAGTLRPVDPLYVQVSEGPGPERDYVKQTLEGTFPDATSATWEIEWLAPPAGTGTAHFYLAGNAANYNGTPSGDFIYGLDVAVPERAVSALASRDGEGARDPFDLRMAPNPAPGAADVTFVLPEPSLLRLSLVDPQGREVRTIVSAGLPAGPHSFRLLGRGEADDLLPQGVYFLVLRAKDDRSARRIVLGR